MDISISPGITLDRIQGEFSLMQVLALEQWLPAIFQHITLTFLCVSPVLIIHFYH